MSTSRKAIQLAAVTTLAFAASTQAAPVTWTGSGANGNFNTDQNWDTNLAPTSGDVATFSSAGSAPSQVPIINSLVSVDGVSLDNSGGYIWQISFDSLATTGLTIGASGVTASGGGDSFVQAATTTLSAAQTWNIGAGTEVTTRAIGGSGKLTKQGAGTLEISSASAGSHTGGIDVVTGVLANSRGTNGTGGTANQVTIFNGATYESRAQNGGVNVLFQNNTTLLGNATASGINGATGQNLRLDSAAGTNVTFSTANATDVLILAEEVSGGAADSVINISGPGRVSLRGTSTYTGSGPVTSYLGSWKVLSGATLGLENYDINTTGVLGFNGTFARPIELNGGTLSAGLTTNSSANIGVGTAAGNNRSAISVTDDSTIIVGKYSSSASTSAGSVTRSAGALTIDGSELTVASGRLGETGSPTGAFTAKLVTAAVTLTDTSTFNVINGPDLLGQPVNTEVELGAVGGGAFGLVKTGTGLLYLTSGSNTYAGSTTVSGGTLRFATNGAQSTTAISVASGAQVRMGNSTATSTKADLSGSGLIFMSDSASNALSLQGSAISPGNSAGILTINGAPVTLALDGAQLASLNIEVVGGGAVAGVDHDQLVIGSALTGLANADLFVNLSGVTNGDLAGDVLTIVTSTSDFTGLSFASVNFTSGWSGDVNYNNGSITLSNLQEVPEPATLGLVASMGMLLLGRRRRND